VFEIFCTTESVKSRNTNKMSEAVEIQAPAADTVSAVKGMKKNGAYIRSPYERNRKLTANPHRQAMARQQDSLPTARQSDFVG
jgi:hypothetical protein